MGSGYGLLLSPLLSTARCRAHGLIWKRRWLGSEPWCPSYLGTGRTLGPGSVLGQGGAVWVTWMLRWMSVLIKSAESKRRTQTCPAGETGLPEMCITGLRGAQQAHPPEQSGLHCLGSIPAGKKECCSGLEVLWWEENLQAISNCKVYPCHSEILNVMFQVCLLANQQWNNSCSKSLFSPFSGLKN